MKILTFPLSVKAPAALILASSLAFLTGCANMVATAPTGNSLNVGGTMKGTIYGGQQPVSGATVQLYSTGISGYGSLGTLYAQTTTSTDGSGSFHFTQTPQSAGTPGPTSTVSSTYGCPTSGDPQMYLLATGGDPGSGTNLAAAELVALGPCSKAGSLFINMNEVTTVATMATMQQYFSPVTHSLGSPNTTQALLGIANAQSGIANLVNIATGTANTTTNPTSSVAGVIVTATPESAKLNTIANIIAACINSTGAIGTTDPCGILFTNAVSQNPTLTSQPLAVFPPATDVLQALYYMFTNPTQSQDDGPTGKLANLYSLPTPNAPFGPALTAQPLDWTLSVAYKSGTSVATNGYCTSTGGRYFNATLKSIAVDATGNIWLNGGSSSANSLVQFSPSGSPLQCFGGTLATGLGLTIDPAGNVWSASASSIYEVPGGSGTPLTWPVTNSLSGIVSDKFGNVFYTPAAASATPVQAFLNASTAIAPFASVDVGGNVVAVTGANYFYPVADHQGRILAPASTGTGFIDLFPATTSNAINGYVDNNIGSSKFQSGSYGFAVDGAGSFFGGNTCCGGALNNTFYKLTVTDPVTLGGAPTVVSVNSAKYLGGMIASRSEIVDGAGNLWAGMLDPVVNKNTTATPPVPADVYALAEVTNDLQTGISPNGVIPAVCATTPDCQTNGGFQKPSLQVVVSLGIDLSGNVWAASQANTTVIEIVGQAVPVVTPLSVNPGVKP